MSKMKQYKVIVHFVEPVALLQSHTLADRTHQLFLIYAFDCLSPSPHHLPPPSPAVKHFVFPPWLMIQQKVNKTTESSSHCLSTVKYNEPTLTGIQWLAMVIIVTISLSLQLPPFVIWENLLTLFATGRVVGEYGTLTWSAKENKQASKKVVRSTKK